MSIGDFPEMLSQRISVWKMLVRRWGEISHYLTSYERWYDITSCNILWYTEIWCFPRPSDCIVLLTASRRGQDKRGPSQKCRDSPWSTFMGKGCNQLLQHAATWMVFVAKRAHSNKTLRYVWDLWHFQKQMLSWPRPEASEQHVLRPFSYVIFRKFQSRVWTNLKLAGGP